MDEKALIILAQMLDKARIQANAIEVTAEQKGVYGEIATALKGTLAFLTNDADAAYEAILDGCSVQEALTSVKDGREG